MKALFLNLFLFLSLTSPAQVSYDREYYLDSLLVETTPENMVYRRIVKNYGTLQNEYLFTDYYNSGQPKMIGKSTSRDFLVKKGQFVSYYENGKKKELINYDKAVPVGIYYSWYESGEKKLVGEYLINKDKNGDPSILRIDQHWDENCQQKVIDGNGFYRDDVDKIESSGKLVAGLKDSIWIGIEKKIKLSFTEEYKNGVLIFGTSIDSLGNLYNYKELNTKPLPKNGIDSFYRFVAKNFRIPMDVSNVKGKIYLSFVIEKDGSIGDVRVIKGIHPKLDSEATQLLYKSPAWEPGILRGVIRRVQYSFPINISGP